MKRCNEAFNNMIKFKNVYKIKRGVKEESFTIKLIKC